MLTHYHYGDCKWHVIGDYPVPQKGEIIHADFNSVSSETFTLVVEIVDWRLRMGPGEIACLEAHVMLRPLKETEAVDFANRPCAKW